MRGIDGLRVINASIMPTIPNANTNGASIMIGEKGADLIPGALLPASEEPVFRADMRRQR